MLVAGSAYVAQLLRGPARIALLISWPSIVLGRGEQGGIHAIPPTLQQSLIARLDRLGPAREVAQIGAVIGRGFSYALLRAVAGIEDTPLQAALERLAESDIVLVQGLPPELASQLYVVATAVIGDLAGAAVL